MTLAEFRTSLTAATPPAGLARPLEALWHAGKGEWDKAHNLAQMEEGEADHDWVHAYLHRVEGDLGNAGYWYRRAKQPVATDALDAEWTRIAEALLAK